MAALRSVTPDPSPGHPEFARAIIRYREAAGMSQRRLAEKTGLSRSYIAMLEGGQRGEWASRDLVLQLAQALGVPPFDLLQLAGRLEPEDRRAGMPLPAFAEVVNADLRLSPKAKTALLAMYEALTD